VTEPEGATWRERSMSRVFDAPRDVVWRAWTEPEQVALWWGPQGMTVPLETVEMDLREGGVFRLTMVADGSGTEFPSEMRFREVVEPGRLVFAWDAQRNLGSGKVTVTFKDLGERTEVTPDFAGFTTDELFAGSEVGWEGQLEKLATYLAERTNNRQEGKWER
jgi:uncharacterized protein YndB with AHSA1/START domain